VVARSYLIDGYNALHQLVDPPPEGIDACRTTLLGLVRGVLRGRTPPRGGGDLVHVVFDTRGGLRAGTHGRDGPVSWSYAVGSADDAIVDIARRNEGSHDGRDLVVVTDDRELRGRAKQLGCRALRVREWFDEPRRDRAAPDRGGPGSAGGTAGPAFRPKDFGLPEGEIDLDALDPDEI
jgi:hypothetical protein